MSNNCSSIHSQLKIYAEKEVVFNIILSTMFVTAA